MRIWHRPHTRIADGTKSEGCADPFPVAAAGNGQDEEYVKAGPKSTFYLGDNLDGFNATAFRESLDSEVGILALLPCMSVPASCLFRCCSKMCCGGVPTLHLNPNEEEIHADGDGDCDQCMHRASIHAATIPSPR